MLCGCGCGGGGGGGVLVKSESDTLKSCNYNELKHAIYTDL